MANIKKFFHYFVYFNLVSGFLSALYMVFIVYAPENSYMPLWSNALEMPHEKLLIRRMYALEAWVIFGFLALYFILSERLLNKKD